MNTAEKNCIWYGRCGEECCVGCGDYTPAEDREIEAYYHSTLRENTLEYEEMILDYADRGCDE